MFRMTTVLYVTRGTLQRLYVEPTRCVITEPQLLTPLRAIIHTAKQKHCTLTVDTFAVTSTGIAYESARLALRRLGFTANKSKDILEKTVLQCIKACHASIAPTLTSTYKKPGAHVD